MKECKFDWDEPKRCATPRGWAVLVNHPERKVYGLSKCIGNYCTYNFPNGSRGPNGETVHAVCYIYRNPETHVAPSDVRLGSMWFHTIVEAREFIEGNIRAYFGLPRS